jgi:hypothetical protein
LGATFPDKTDWPFAMNSKDWELNYYPVPTRCRANSINLISNAVVVTKLINRELKVQANKLRVDLWSRRTDKLKETSTAPT